MKKLAEMKTGTGHTKSKSGQSGRMLYRLLPLAVTAWTALAPVSCSRDNVVSTGGRDDGTATVSLSISLLSTGSASYYEDGSEYENYIDITGGDYRIYFFTDNEANGNDKFIAGLTSAQVSEIQGRSFRSYAVLGEVPDDLAEYINASGALKVVILANWGGYDDSGFVSAMVDESGATTIEDVCSETWSSYVLSDNYTVDADHLIPFFGVQEYSGVEFILGETEILSEPVYMLRACAKVEVVVDNSDLEFESVVLHGFNSYGYCAPEGIYKASDYTVEVNGKTEYNGSPAVHLVGGANDGAPDTSLLSLSVTENTDGKTMWYAYVPEYDNTSDIDLSAYIQVNVSGYEDSEDYRIRFRNYSSGAAISGSDYDIGRNTIYRFVVDLADNYLNVHVDKWEDSFRNDFEFGFDYDDET